MRVVTVIEKLKEVKGILEDATVEDLEKVSENETDEILDIIDKIQEFFD